MKSVFLRLFITVYSKPRQDKLYVKSRAIIMALGQIQSNPLIRTLRGGGGGIESIRINAGVSVLSGLNISKKYGLSSPKDKANCA